ncbi:MAG: glycosyltransferase family 39 protein [Armatimonadota bacterium]|jgi:4-amino-4-deoxy-L-arabinose transferase-like glycosyltransferase
MEDQQEVREGKRGLLVGAEIAALVIFLAASVTYAIITPPLSAPDEDGHTIYARAVSHGVLPNPFAQTGERIGPDGRVIFDCAQAHHPPLFYTVVAGVHMLTGRDPGLLTPIGRGLGVLSGLAALLLMRAAMHRAFDDRPLAVAAGLALAAGSATFAFIMGSFNNETLAVLLVALSVYLAVRAMQSDRPMRWFLALGVTLGAGLLTKLTAAVIIVPLAVAAIGAARRAGASGWRVAGGALLAVGIAAVIAGPWFVRNLRVVGSATFNCAQRPPLFSSLDEVIFQPEASILASMMAAEEMIAGSWLLEWLLRDHHTLVADLLVAGGLTAASRPAWMLLVPLVIGALTLKGLLRLRRAEAESESGLERRHLVCVLIGIPVMAAAGIIHQTLMVDGHIIRWAGRYVPVMIPVVAMGIALGLSELLPARLRPALPLVALVFAVALNAWALFRVMRFFA